MKKEDRYVYGLTLLYFIISLIGILHHELWLDEAHHWLMARDSNSISELLRVTRPDGHPILWSIILYGISGISLNPLGMQLIHILFSTATVFVFLRKAPLSRIFKTLFIFGYFMVFEYNLISRNYILGVLFLFLACSVFKDRQLKFTLLCFYLAMAANVHLMFTVIAFALLCTLIFENYLDKKQVFGKQYFAGYLIFAIGIGLVAVQIATTESDWFFEMLGDIPLTERIGKAYIPLMKGLIAIPDFRTLHFWNTNLLVNLSKPFAAVLGILVYFIPVVLFFKNRKTLFFVYTALIGSQIFFLITQRAAPRFYGMTYIIIIIGLWIENYYPPESSRLSNFLTKLKVKPLRKPIIYGILVIHLISGSIAYVYDYKYSFMAGKDTVDYLKSKNLETLPVISLTCDGTCLSPYLEKKVWFLCDGSYQSYCHWDFLCARNIDGRQVNSLILDYMANHQRAIYASYLSVYKNPKPNVWKYLSNNVKVRFLQKFDGESIVKDNYFVFEICKVEIKNPANVQ